MILAHRFGAKRNSFFSSVSSALGAPLHGGLNVFAGLAMFFSTVGGLEGVKLAVRGFVRDGFGPAFFPEDFFLAVLDLSFGLAVLLGSVGSVSRGVAGAAGEGLLLDGNLVVDKFAVVFEGQLRVVVDVQLDLGPSRTHQLHLLLIVELRQVLVLHHLLNCQPPTRVKLQQTTYQVQTRRTRTAPQKVPTVHLLTRCHQLQHVLRNVQAQRLQVLTAGRARPGNHSFDLVHGGSAWKDGLAVEDFCDEAAEGPHVYFFVVVSGAEEEFGGAVPASGDVVGHDDEFLVRRFFHEADETEVAEFGFAVFVDEDIGGLDVSVDEVGVVQVEDGLGHLMNYVLLVPLLQLRVPPVLPDQSVQVDVHVLEHQVDVLVVPRPDHLFQPDDVRVLELSQEHDFAVGALGVGGVGEGVKVFFEGFHLFGFLVSDFPDVSVGAAAYLFADVVLF